jgi:hypothetical protein
VYARFHSDAPLTDVAERARNGCLRAPWWAKPYHLSTANARFALVEGVHPSVRGGTVIEELTRDTFARQLNSRFRVERNGAGAVTLELVEAGEVRSSGRSETFSILFRGPPDVFLPQAIYRFEHDAIGAFDLFIVPIRRDQDGVCYESLFNRLR